MKRLFMVLAVMLAVFGGLWTGSAQAGVGVGIMPGIMRVNEPLSPGQAYKLSPLQVVNTGTVTGEYEVVVARMMEGQQDELQPEADYFSFSPSSFYLEPGESQLVTLRLNLPIKAPAGDYLARVAAQPMPTGGGTSVGAAAAAKIYFTVKPANIGVGMLNVVASFFWLNAPISYIIPGAIALWLIIHLLRRRFKLEISRK